MGSPRKSGREYWAVKESVFPFNRFHGQDILLSPEMRSTGEVMGLDDDLGIAYAKSQMAAGGPLPTSGRVFISVSDAHKDEVAEVGRQFADLGFELIATSGTAAVLEKAGPQGAPHLQAGRGPPQRRGPAEEPRNPDRHQHPLRRHARTLTA